MMNTVPAQPRPHGDYIAWRSVQKALPVTPVFLQHEAPRPTNISCIGLAIASLAQRPAADASTSRTPDIAI